MSGKSWRDRLDDLLDRIDRVEKIVGSTSMVAFFENDMALTAVERHVEIIGEITRHIPDDIKAEWPEIPWADILGMRNILAHGYDVILPDLIWHTARNGLRQLQLVVRKIKNANPVHD